MFFRTTLAAILAVCLVVSQQQAVLAADPLTSAKIDAVLSVYHAIAIAAHARGVEDPNIILGGGTASLEADEPELQADMGRIARQHGFSGLEEWSTLYRRILLAHEIDKTKDLRRKLEGVRVQVLSNDLSDASKAELNARFDAQEKLLADTIAQAEADAPAVLPYAERLNAMFR